MIPLTLYVHLPWCVRRCPYCDFNAHALRGDLPEDAYLAALLDDIDAEAATVGGRQVHAVFFGGGTPSLFSAAGIGRVLDRAAAAFDLAADVEITLEANPGTAEAGRFAGYRAAGVNRLSLGIQSFDPRMLQRLGRIHDGDEARAAIDYARAAGFERVNLDLMHGLPGQTVAAAIADIETAIAYEPGHLSWYQLTLEPNTPFHADPPLLPDEDTLAAIQDGGQQSLEAAGYRQYEVSAWARHGEECRHNLNYWRFGDYVGVGAGAHGKVTTADGRIVRRWKRRHPSAWTTATDDGRLDGERTLDAGTVVFEFLLNALRLRDGFTESDFELRTGLPFEEVAARVHLAADRGLLEFSEKRWRPSDLGWRFLNDLQAMFLPDDSRSADPYAQVEEGQSRR